MTGEDPFAVASLCEAFQRTASAFPDQVALRTPGGAVEITWKVYADRVRRIATGLAAVGVRPGDTVGIMLVNRPEFALCDTAVLHLGATPFSVYNTSSPEQLSYLFGSAGNRVVITEPTFVEQIKASGADIDVLVCAEGDVDGAISLADLEERVVQGFDFEAAWRSVGRDDLLTLIYTSGTTGPPKGVELTHGCMLEQLRMTNAVLPAAPGDSGISYLPSAHIADRWGTHYSTMMYGCQITYVADAKLIATALPEVRPTFWGAVPRVWEKLKAALEANGITDPSALSPEMKTGVLAKIGLDRLRYSVSGAAPIAPEVLDYFTALGVTISEVWGMSELACCATANPLDDIRVGTVGKALPGVELKLAEDGELLVHTPTLMRGYRNDPDQTAEVVDAEGWMHTGDIGTIDEDGYVRIVDRKKEIIINAAGKNMSPANIELALKASSPLIGQAVVIGDKRPYNVALLVIDPDAAAAYASRVGLPDASAQRLAQDEGVAELVAEGVAAANTRLSRVEQIKRYQVLDCDWEPGGEELTPTSKLKRKPIAEKYAMAIEALYAEGSPR